MRLLVLNVSRQSTGEVRFLTALLKQAGERAPKVDLAMHSELHGLFEDFPGNRIAVPLSRKVAPSDILSFLDSVGRGYERVLLMDLTSAMLEYSWTREQAETLLVEICAMRGIELSLFDPMAVMEKDERKLRSRRERCESEISEFIAENLRVPGHVSVKKAFYFSKFLKPRTLSQLVRIPDSATILRSVPYTWPSDDDSGAFRYFACHFERVPRIAPSGDLAVLGFSRMVENLLPGETIAEYFAWLCQRLHDDMRIREVVVIDPSRFLVGVETHSGIRLEIHERMERTMFLERLGEASFAGFFIPTTTVGVTAIQNGIPFVSFHSTKESSGFVPHRHVANAIPRYTSLGIWEDFAFIRNLVRKENPYFEGVRMLDVSDPRAFRECRRELDDGTCHQRIVECRSALASLQLPDFAEAVSG